MGADQDRGRERAQGGGCCVRVKIPTDIDRPDQIVWGLTARQLLILGPTCLLALAIHLGLEEIVPSGLAAAAGGLLAAVGCAIAFVQPDGVVAERWLAAGVRHLLSANRRVDAPEGVPEVGSWARSGESVEAIEPPARDVARDGVIDLGGARFALVCRASSINLVLRAEEEQVALIEGLGHLLNALDGPTSFVVRSERMDLRAHIDHIKESARGLPSLGLETAARAHAAYLTSLGDRRDVLRREVYIVLSACERDPDQASVVLRRRAEEAGSLLSALGIGMRALNGEAAAELLSSACDPSGSLPVSGLSLPTEIISGAIE